MKYCQPARSAFLFVALALLAARPAAAESSRSRSTDPQTLEVRSVAQDPKPDEKHKLFKHLNINKKGLAIRGYDPVAYFPEGGGKATKGKKKITVTHLGVTHRFASEENKRAFLADPAKYEPQYGGWCAWAMADGKGDKVEVDPESFTVEDGKLYLFYDGLWGNTRKKWKKKGAAAKLAVQADKNWVRISKPKKKK